MTRAVPCVVLAFAALVASACEINTKIDADGAVNGPKDGLGGGGGGGGGGGNTVSGAVGLSVLEAECLFIWDLSGSVADCSGCDLAFDLAAEAVNGDCGEADDFSGLLELDGGVAYFEDYYWGMVTSQGGGEVEWYTYEYLYGGTYTYQYVGYLEY